MSDRCESTSGDQLGTGVRCILPVGHTGQHRDGAAMFEAFWGDFLRTGERYRFKGMPEHQVLVTGRDSLRKVYLTDFAEVPFGDEDLWEHVTDQGGAL